MTKNRKHDIRVQADQFRAGCKIGRYGILNLFRECDRKGYKRFRYPLGDRADLGFALKKEKDIVIFTNSSSRLSREIFTLAHEIGHVILHFGTENSFIDDRSTISSGSIEEKEEEANYFAACLLMPADDVSRFIDLEIPDFAEKGLSALDIARIMSEFNVSFDMAINRLAELELADTVQKTRLDNVKTELKVSNLLHSVGGNARLNEPDNVIDLPYEFLDDTIYNYNHRAIPKETLERVLDCYHLSIEDVSDRLLNMNEDDYDDLDDLIGGLDE